MKIRKYLILATAIPWAMVVTWALTELFILGCGGVESSDLIHLNALKTTSIVLSVIHLIMWLCYLTLPSAAGLLCVIVAKNYKFFQDMANYSAGMYFDVVMFGGYKKLYKRGVRTYKKISRSSNNVRKFESRPA